MSGLTGTLAVVFGFGLGAVDSSATAQVCSGFLIGFGFLYLVKGLFE